MTTSVAAEAPKAEGRNLAKFFLTNRIALLGVLLVAVVGTFMAMSATGSLSASYDSDYMSAALINMVPMCLLGLAELLVIVSGRGGIDLSLGSIVSLVGMLFGFAYGMWGWPLPLAIALALLAGAACGSINGYLVAYLGFPPLIATLATYYAFWSLALVSNRQIPISTPPIQQLYSLSAPVELPLIGKYLPLVPLGVFIFLIPGIVVVWLMTERFAYGRRLYAIGTNDIAAEWAGLDVKRVRMLSYVSAGIIAGLVAVVTVSQFASARPDAGTSGNGMALPAITIAVLGGVAITGGLGKVIGVVLASLLVVWLNAGLLLTFPGNFGSQVQLLALGLILVGAALLNGITARRYSGSK